MHEAEELAVCQLNGKTFVYRLRSPCYQTTLGFQLSFTALNPKYKRVQEVSFCVYRVYVHSHSYMLTSSGPLLLAPRSLLYVHLLFLFYFDFCHACVLVGY
eukprot:m.49607 g.49607  ORF g.49607 m.49607 type:complete len:101 (+) comp11107_c0_seq1:117-419(+)